MSRSAGCAGRRAIPPSARSQRRNRRAPRCLARAGRSPSPPRTAPRRRCVAPRLSPVLQTGEVERADRLRDELAVASAVELLADDDRRRLEREVGDLGADLLERTRGLRGDLATRLLEAALPFGLRLCAHALLHRPGRVASLGEDLLAVASRLVHQLAVLLEQLPGLLARGLRLLDRAANLLATVGEHLLDR